MLKKILTKLTYLNVINNQINVITVIPMVLTVMKFHTDQHTCFIGCKTVIIS